MAHRMGLSNDHCSMGASNACAGAQRRRPRGPGQRLTKRWLGVARGVSALEVLATNFPNSPLRELHPCG
jgi:hypothetical protein